MPPQLAAVRLCHFQKWFDSWLPDSVFSAGRAVVPLLWFMEECLGSEEDDRVHIFVADVVKSSDTVD